MTLNQSRHARTIVSREQMTHKIDNTSGCSSALRLRPWIVSLPWGGTCSQSPEWSTAKDRVEKRGMINQNHWSWRTRNTVLIHVETPRIRTVLLCSALIISSYLEDSCHHVRRGCFKIINSCCNRQVEWPFSTYMVAWFLDKAYTTLPVNYQSCHLDVPWPFNAHTAHRRCDMTDQIQIFHMRAKK